MGKDGRLFNLEGTGWAVKSVKYTRGVCIAIRDCIQNRIQGVYIALRDCIQNRTIFILFPTLIKLLFRVHCSKTFLELYSPLCINAFHSPSSNFHVYYSMC